MGPRGESEEVSKELTTPQQAAAVSTEIHDSFPTLSPPNVFIGGPLRVSPGFPLETCGNDGLSGIKIFCGKLARKD